MDGNAKRTLFKPPPNNSFAFTPSSMSGRIPSPRQHVEAEGQHPHISQPSMYNLAACTARHIPHRLDSALQPYPSFDTAKRPAGGAGSAAIRRFPGVAGRWWRFWAHFFGSAQPLGFQLVGIAKSKGACSSGCGRSINASPPLFRVVHR